MDTDEYDVTKDVSDVEEPNVAGWYASQRGGLFLIFLMRDEIPGWFTRQWFAVTSGGDITPCDWGYIAQAGPVVPLVKAI